MAQETQSERAAGELLIAGTISGEDFPAFIRAYKDTIPISAGPDASALMLVEEQPRRVIERSAQQGLLLFAFFDPTFDFTPYTSGRIFHALGELRWERQYPSVQVVYTGHREHQPELRDARETKLEAYIPRQREYLLFGKRLDEQQLDRIGPAAQRGDFAEVRIPRLLRYPQLPELTDAERVGLAIFEYVDPATACNVAYRFKSLVSFQKQPETTGANKG